MSSEKKLVQVILSFFLIAVLIQSKNIEKKILIKEFNIIPQTIFLTRLDATHSDTSITIKIRLLGQKPINMDFLKVGLLNAQKFSQYKQATTCQLKRKFYSQSFDLKFFDNTQGMLTVKIDKLPKDFPISFLFLYECDFIEQVDNVGLLKVDIIQPSHKISFKDCYSFGTYALMAVFCIAAVLLNLVKIIRHLKTYPNIESFTVLLGFVLYSLAIITHFFSLVNKANEGEEIEILQIFSQTIIMVVKIGVSVFFIVLTWSFLIGETITLLQFIILFLLTAILNVLGQFFAHRNREPTSNQHLFEGLVGSIVLLTKVISVVLLVVGCYKVGVKALNKDKKFIQIFIDSGFIFLMANVLSVFLAKYITEAYWLYESIPLFENIIRISVLSYLSYLTLYKEKGSVQEKKLEKLTADEPETSKLAGGKESNSKNVQKSNEAAVSNLI